MAYAMMKQIMLNASLTEEIAVRVVFLFLLEMVIVMIKITTKAVVLIKVTAVETM